MGKELLTMKIRNKCQETATRFDHVQHRQEIAQQFFPATIDSYLERKSSLLDQSNKKPCPNIDTGKMMSDAKQQCYNWLVGQIETVSAT